jgi:serine/threonine-protein kinase HipA
VTSLDVYLHSERCGVLERLERGRLSFRYSEQWVEDDRLVLSHSLPLQDEPFDDDTARPYFAGLLPEGEFLRAVARTFHVSAGNAFALLDAIGGECAGAVSLAAAGKGPPEPGPPRFLDSAELAKLVAELPANPLRVGEDEEGLRLSLAGVQEKLPVIFQGGKIGITRGDPPSTHIIKLPSPHFDGMTANEALCLELARRSGLDAVQAQARTTALGFEAAEDDDDYLLVVRYDREKQAGHVVRFHQEDFCQSLGFVPELKYESDGGPGIAQCADLLRKHSAAPAVDILAFADILVFNLVIGNHDAHAKNYSLLLEGPRAPRLAPAYDLVSTTAYPDLHRKTAMKYGGENRPDYIRGRHLDRAAKDLGMSPSAFRRRAQDLCDRVEPAVGSAIDALDPELASAPIVSRIRKRVEVGLRRVRTASLEK